MASPTDRELHDPGPPPAGDVLVEHVHASVGDGLDARPAGPGDERLRRHLAALTIRQKDQIGVRLHDELRRQLRVGITCAGRSVGDVRQSEQAVHLADEGVARRGEQRRVEFVEVRRVPAPCASATAFSTPVFMSATTSSAPST